jgi:hypothetical protein
VHPANPGAMRRGIDELSRRLLHRGAARISDHDTCSVCHRTPLVGERVHLYANGLMTCALCRSARREEPETTVLVHHSEFGHAVKPLARVAL